MRYIVIGTGVHEQHAHVVDAPNPGKAVAESGLSPAIYDVLDVYLLARSPNQPVARFESRQMAVWDVSDDDDADEEEES